MKLSVRITGSLLYFFVLIAFTACNENVNTDKPGKGADSSRQEADTLYQQPQPEIKDSTSSATTYANARFREVVVDKTAAHTYSISGEAQLFEANFGWVVEDGHNELKNGFEMTDAGAPEWGNFEFTIEVQKQRENSTLTFILFESSAKDGSRQHELAIPLD